MTNHDDSSTWGTGCAVVLSLCVILLLCGGGLVVLVGGSFYFVQRQAAEARQAAVAARERAIMAELQSAGGLAETPLPPGAHVIAIGPDGELFWDNQPVSEAQLDQTLSALAPSEGRGAIPVYIRPGIGAPEETIETVCRLADGYDQVVEPPPASQIHIAPEPGDDRPPAKLRPKK